MEYTYQGLKVYCEKKGRGPDLVLLHGWGCDGKIFSGIVSELMQYFTIYNIDLPGFGNSDEPKNYYTLDDYVDMLIDFINKFKINNPIILGHSFGGRIAIRFTSKTNLTKKLILVDSAGIKPKGYFKTKLKILKYKLKKKTYKLFKKVNKYQTLIQNSGSNDYKNATPVMKKTLSVITKTFQEKELKNIKTNTLLIWGKNDYTTLYQDGEKMQKLLENSAIVSIENVGHFPFLEKPYHFMCILKTFLEVNEWLF